MIDTEALKNLPEELTRRDQWVAWRTETRNGKPTKVPYSPSTGHRAKSNDSSTWSSYEEAIAYALRERMDGVGFAFSADDPYCGIDLDHSRGPETGAIADWAQHIIDELDSYTEISPSGTGVHVIVKAKLQPDSRHKMALGTGEFEVYDRGRFFTMTGRRVG